jgi:nucleotide-binding universal stress UspA family protein
MVGACQSVVHHVNDCKRSTTMANKIVVAYDGSPHSRDALALAGSLSELTGASLAVAHVHRGHPEGGALSATAAGRETFLRRESERHLEQALHWLGREDVQPLVVAGTTTASGLRELARLQQTDLLVFGSAHSRPSGRAHPGSAARRLLHGGRCAIAVAPAGWRERAQLGLSTVAVADDDGSASARRTAEQLASVGNTRIVHWPEEEAQLLLFASHPTSPAGKVMMSARAEQVVQSSTSPVVVLPHGVALTFANQLARAA